MGFTQTIPEILFIFLFLSQTFSFEVNFVYEPKDKTILEGRTVEFLCVFSTWEQDFRCVWKHNSSTQQQISKHKVDFMQEDLCSLRIYDVTESDSGQYSCHVINTTDVIVGSSRPATLSVVPFPTLTCQSNQDSYIVGDVLILYCIAEIIDGVSTHPSKLEWGSFENVSARITSIQNGTHLISQNEMVAEEKFNKLSFPCRLSVDNFYLKNEGKRFCKKSINVNINVTIFTSDNLQVGQSAAFQCKTEHDCPQCEYNWKISNADLLVNISEPHLNLNITDKMIDSILICHVTSSHKVHGSATFIISLSTLSLKTTKNSKSGTLNTTSSTSGDFLNVHLLIIVLATVCIIMFLILIIVILMIVIIYKKLKTINNENNSVVGRTCRQKDMLTQYSLDDFISEEVVAKPLQPTSLTLGSNEYLQPVSHQNLQQESEDKTQSNQQNKSITDNAIMNQESKYTHEIYVSDDQSGQTSGSNMKTLYLELEESHIYQTSLPSQDIQETTGNLRQCTSANLNIHTDKEYSYAYGHVNQTQWKKL